MHLDSMLLIVKDRVLSTQAERKSISINGTVFRDSQVRASFVVKFVGGQMKNNTNEVINP